VTGRTAAANAAWAKPSEQRCRVREHDARRHAEEYRGLLGRVLDEVEDLHPGLRVAIERALH
jgi:hypothetical protein